jgi:hypothetical protein
VLHGFSVFHEAVDRADYSALAKLLYPEEDPDSARAVGGSWA